MCSSVVVSAWALLLFGGCFLPLRSEDLYSSNAVCKQNNCINPVFPGLEDLSTLEDQTYQCQPNILVHKHMQFCKHTVHYDVALAEGNATDVLGMVRQAERSAVTTFVYHLAGMNLEAKEYKHPESSGNACVQSVWKMVCNTYFPRAHRGCDAGKPTPYLRPCRNTCEHYVEACQVRCCDEGVRCTFDKTEESIIEVGKTITKSGYADILGPSLRCTGAAQRSIGSLAPGAFIALLLSFLLPLWPEGGSGPPSSTASAAVARRDGRGRLSMATTAAVLLVPLAAMSLQGCDAVGHPASSWETKPGYLAQYRFVLPPMANGDPPASQAAALSSCSVPGLPPKLRCNGNGICKQWGNTTDKLPMLACECDRDWADPECRTRRKSQTNAFILSLFGGFLGLDRFYLGEWYAGCTKLATLGGLGAWWLFDVARTGSAPIYTDQFRLAADLPHWVYVFTVTSFFVMLGLFMFEVAGTRLEEKKQMSKLLLHEEVEFLRAKESAVRINPEDRVGIPTRASFGIPRPAATYLGPVEGYGTVVPPELRHTQLHQNPLSSISAHMAAERIYQAPWSLTPVRIE